MARREWNRRLRDLGRQIDQKTITPDRVGAAQRALDRGETGSSMAWVMARNLRLACIELESSVPGEHADADELLAATGLNHITDDERAYAHNIIALYQGDMMDESRFVDGPRLLHRYDPPMPTK